MKILWLVRHAKSSWTFDLRDHDRPLGKRGRKDVIKMGKHLAEHQARPEIIISSTASRALYTALYLCDQMDLDENCIHLNQNLYHAGPTDILTVIRHAPECERLALFGHNPGFTDTVNALAGLNIDNVPTCGVVGLSFSLNTWDEIDFGSGRLEFHYWPKEI